MTAADAGAGADADADADAVHVLDDGQGTRIAVAARGATWLSFRVPLGQPQAGAATRELLLGRPTPAEHASQPGYLGAVVGRYANRLAGARFVLDGRQHRLAPNEGPHQLHGGPDGFDRRVWALQDRGPAHLLLALHSPDGDQGYPGALQATVRYTLQGPGCVGLQFSATVDAPCPVNLTSHAYWNLDGDADPALTIATHRLSVAATHWLPVDEALIPTGAIAPVAGTAMDFREPRTIGTQRLDHCFVLDGGPGPAVVLEAGDGRLRLTLHTDAPGLQVYGGHFLAGTPDRQGRAYAAGAGLALEPQAWPDSPNHPEWLAHPAWRGPGPVLRPPAVFSRQMRVQVQPLTPG